eukprot:UN26085
MHIFQPLMAPTIPNPPNKPVGYDKKITKQKKMILTNKSLSKEEIMKKSDLTESEYDKFTRYERLLQEVPHLVDKRTEQCVKFLVFFVFFIVGLKTNELDTWLHTERLWTFEEATEWEHFYYLLEFGWYGHRAITSPLEYSRSDFWEMFLHHIVTSVLIALSYWLQFQKVGVMIMLIHDPSDSLLAFTKSVSYLGFSTLADIGF